MNILITGVGGFIGRNFLQRLKKTSHKVFALDKHLLPNDEILGIEEFYQQDITQPFKIDQPFDIVFHLAACNLTNVGEAQYDTFYEVNVKGTSHVIRAVDAKQFVFLSTTKVYKNNGEKITESSPISVKKHYERSKYEAEEVCQKIVPADGLTILRSVNIVGEGQAPKAILPVFFKNAISDRPLCIIGSGQTKLQLLSVEDLIGVFECLIAKPGGYGVVNIAGRDVVTLKKLAGRIIRYTGSGSRIHCPDNNTMIFSKVTTQKAKEILNWEARVSLDEILRKYYKFVAVNE